MSWHEQNREFNFLIKHLFHDEDWQNRAEAARGLGLLKDGRATNLLCRALQIEKDVQVSNRIIEALGRIGDGRATLRIVEKLKEELNKHEGDKFRLIYMIEALMRIGDKRALVYIGPLLNSPDDQLRNIAEKTFDTIEPNWREILEKRSKERTIQDVFKIKL